MKESKLHRIADGGQTPRGVVVFVHGLGGDAFGTWKTGTGESDTWPQWLAEDLSDVGIYSLDYDASPSVWLGDAMPLVDRATNVLSHFELEESMRLQPTIFVCHSLGGLLVKEVLRQAGTLNSESWEELIDQAKGVVFLATPHAGARLATYVTGLGTLLGLRPGVNVDELEANEPALRGLNTWYAQNTARLGIDNLAFFETRDTKGVRIVDETSANPGLAGVIPRSIDADHFEICKPTSREALAYRQVMAFLGKHLPKLRPPEAMAAAKSSDERPTRFFISYRRDQSLDRDLARTLADRLKAAGQEVFIDVQLCGGTEWAKEIARHIDWCDYFVVLLSDKSAESEMVLTEVRRAHRRRKHDGTPRVYPIRVRFDGFLDFELESYLGPILQVPWTSDDDTGRVMEELTDGGSGPAAIVTGRKIAGAPSTFQGGDTIVRERDYRRPQPSPQIPRPGGTIRLDDPFYVERDDDRIVANIASRIGETVVIKAPRQFGKSSLLLRYADACAKAGKKYAFFDFQQLTDAALAEHLVFLPRLTRHLLRSFGLENGGKLNVDPSGDCTEWIEDHVLARVDGPLAIVLDEVDRLLGKPYQKDFFTMLRHWHNSRALPGSPWGRVDLALAIATEPYLLIPTADRSPFNVTPPINLEAFTRTELDTLNQSYRNLLKPGQLDDLHELLAGHPYLTRLAYYRMTVDSVTLDHLSEHGHEPNGPFGEHLRALQFQLDQHGLVGPMQDVIKTRSATDVDTYYRLRGAGLVIGDGRHVVPANILYHRFFKALQ